MWRQPALNRLTRTTERSPGFASSGLTSIRTSAGKNESVVSPTSKPGSASKPMILSLSSFSLEAPGVNWVGPSTNSLLWVGSGGGFVSRGAGFPTGGAGIVSGRSPGGGGGATSGARSTFSGGGSGAGRDTEGGPGGDEDVKGRATKNV